MKKLFLSISILFGLSVNAFAGTVSVTPFISGQDVSVDHLETQRTTFSNVINGNIEGGINIKAGSLVSADFSNSVSPVTRWDESFTDFTVTGMLPPTSGSLSSTTTAGTSYVDGYRVVIGSTAHTYTASKDTYVYVHSGGYYVYQEVSNGATAPSTPANTLLLAKVVTSGTLVSSVSDLRTLGISLTNSSSIVPTNYRDGLFISRDSVSTITVQPGSCEVNSMKISKTTATTLTLGTDSDWAGGSSLRTTSAYGYVGVDSSGNLKLHTTAPTNTDYALSFTLGKKRYATWSSTVYRILGWFYMNSTGSGELNSYEVGNIRESDIPNFNSNSVQGQVSTGNTTYTDDTNALIHFYSSGNPISVAYNVASANSSTSANSFTISVDSAGIIGTDRWMLGSTSSTHLFNCTVFYNNNFISQGSHTIQGRFLATGNTAYVNQRTIEVTEK